MSTRNACLIAIGFGVVATAVLAGPPAEIRPYGNNVIAITIYDDFNISPGTNAQNYVVQKLGGGTVGVQSVGREQKIYRLIEVGWPYQARLQNTVYLMLTQPLEETVDYVVNVASAVTGTAMSLPVSLRATSSATDLVKVNQCGYLPVGRKLAYLGGYLGDQGPLSLEHISRGFRLIDLTTNQAVFEGVATLSKSGDSRSGENVYRIEFTDFQTPGNYVIEVEGIGRSHPFSIGNNVFNEPMVTLARGLYHQRCGLELKAPHTQWPHAACHRGSAKLLTIYDSMDSIMSSLPNYVDPSGKLIDGWGGWHDAGDYDRLGSRIRWVVMDLLETYDAHPSKFYDGQFNIPESGNGIPDILDEAKWGLDWFERMFDPSDGGFYYRIETTQYGFTMPEHDNQQLYCMAKYPYYSTWAGQCFALASRLFQQHDPQLAAHYLDIARAALAYGQRELPTSNDATRLRRAIGQLAAEIYVTSGDTAAHQIFLNQTNRESMSYALCTRSNVSTSARRAARNVFTNAANSVLNGHQSTGYATCFTGTNGGDEAVWQAATLLRGYRINGNVNYYNAARLSLDYHLGANPLGYVWITGVGKKYPMHVLQHPSIYDGIEEPVPGVPVFGPRALSATDGSTHAKVFAQNLYPVNTSYPYMRSYAELPPVVAISEFTIHSQSTALLAYSFFAPASQGPASVKASHVFYNNSSFDGYDASANADDDDAIAIDKVALRPGQQAGFANYTSYVHGLNGIMIDIANMPGIPMNDDFVLKVGNSNNPEQWTAGPLPVDIAVRPGSGVDGSDRITLILADGAIVNKWLELKVKASSRTGLTSDEVFYFGNLVGESGDSADMARVDTMDEVRTRNDNHKTFKNPATITNPFDYNRDGKVDTSDEIIVRRNNTTFLTDLNLITLP